jgi:hypothetical protein
MTRESIAKTRVALAALAAGLGLLAVGVPVASAAPAATAKATDKCWLQVVNDWLQHGQVTGTYAIPCYTQAIQNLSAYPDISQYSSAIDDIHRALLAALHQDRGGGPPTSSNGGSTPGPSSGSSGGSNNTGGPTGGATKPRGLFKSISEKIGPGNAQSIPLPLLVLGGFALLLLLTAAVTWFARRLQARRAPGPPAPATSSVRPES